MPDSEIGGEEDFDAQELLESMAEEQKESSDDLMNLTSFKIATMKALLGLVEYQEWNEEIDGYETKFKKVGERLCSKQAVMEIIATIEGIVNPNVVGSYFQPNDVSSTGKEAIYAIIDKIVEKHEEYNIDGMGDANQIISIVNSNLKGAVKKAAGGKFMKYKQEKEKVNVTKEFKEGGEEKESLLSKFGLS